MSVGLYIEGKAASAGRTKAKAVETAERIAALLMERDSPWPAPAEVFESEDGATAVWSAFPCAERVAIEVRAGGGIIAEANTSSAGPGFHRHVCRTLRGMEPALGVRWDAKGGGDDTGYFDGGDPAGVESHMRGWLMELARVVTGEAGAGAAAPLLIAMPIGARFSTPGFAHTPLGPRSREWFVRVAAGAEPVDGFFAWWEDGWSAKTHRGAALAAMWADVRWREPMDEGEAALHRAVLSALAASHRLDAELPQPWAEWLELIDISGDDGDRKLRPIVAANAAALGEPARIGYRRSEVHYMPFGGVGITLPGAMGEAEDDEGTAIYYDDRRVVRVSSMTFEPDGAAAAPSDLPDLPPPDAEVIDEWVEAGRRGRLSNLGPDPDDDGRLNYRVEVVAPCHLVFCTINVPDAADEPFVREVARSVEVKGMVPEPEPEAE